MDPEANQQQNPQNPGVEDDDDNRNLIVNYIPQTYTEGELLELFKPYGNIESCKIVQDRVLKKSLGYGFVKFFNPLDAKNAIANLSGRQVGNKVLKVSIAKPSVPGKGANLYVAGLDPTSSDETLQAIFAPYGTILESKTLIDYQTNQCRGVGFVRMNSREEAQNAIRSLNNQMVSENSKPLQVKFADNNDDKKRDRGGMMRTAQSNFVRYDPYNNMYQNYGFGSATTQGMAGMQTAAVNSAFFGSPSPTSATGTPAVPMMYPQAPVQQQSSAEAPTLFVYNIPTYSDDNLLYQLFCPFGAISSVKIIRDEGTQTCKGYGFVSYVSIENAQQAIIALNGYKLNGKSLQVSFKKTK